MTVNKSLVCTHGDHDRCKFEGCDCDCHLFKLVYRPGSNVWVLIAMVVAFWVLIILIATVL